MQHQKRILVVYPHNFFVQRTGTNTRYIELLKYFKHRNFNVDLLTLEGFCTSWQTYPQDKWELIDNIYIYDFKKGQRWQRFKNRKKDIPALIRKRLPFCRAFRRLPDMAYPGMKRMLNGILETNAYDYIVISYVYWANLLKSPAIKQNKCTTILTLEDFLTLNRYDSTDGDIKIGPMIEEEIRRVNLFDQVICISREEQYFFSCFSPAPKYHYVPFFVESHLETPETGFDYDLFFLGSDNPHNIKGIQWFLDNVMPLLNQSTRVLIAGAVTQRINGNNVNNGNKSNKKKHNGKKHNGKKRNGKKHNDKNRVDYKNVTFIKHIEDLDEVYNKSKIVICPLLGGTGMKIKVVEALSYGKPVVTTSRGVSGFASRLHNGCTLADSPKAFAKAVNDLLRSDLFYRSQQELAVDFFLQHFEKNMIYTKLDDVFLKKI